MTKLRDELVNDPLGLGYAGMTDQQAADSLNAKTRIRHRRTMSAGEIFEAVNPGEYQALQQASKTRVDRVLALGAEIIVGPGNTPNAVQELLTAFGGSSVTVQALAALRQQSISRAEELELGSDNTHLGIVFPLNVARARAE